jgi:hypothetical protein
MDNKERPLPKKNLGPLAKAPPSRFKLSPGARLLLKHFGIGFLVIALAAILVWGVYHLTRLPVFTITEVTVSGGETIDTEAVKANVVAVLDGTYGRLIPRRFFLFYPHQAIVAAVEATDRVRDVSVVLSSPRTLDIRFGEYVPFALWCAGDDSHACYFLSDDGYAFAKAPVLSGGAMVRYQHTGTAPVQGASFLSPEDFWKTVTFTQLLAADALFVTSVAVDRVGDAYYTLTTGGEVRTALRDDPAKVAENLRTVLRSEEFSTLREKDFHYIDLRFGNKVYVSEVDVSLVLASSTPTTTDSGITTIDEAVTTTVPLSDPTTLTH